MKNNKILILLTCAGLVAMQQTQAYEWNIDLTKLVKSFNGRSFTANTDTLGDPLPGISKQFVIKINADRGGTINFTYKEGDTVPAFSVGEIVSAKWVAEGTQKGTNESCWSDIECESNICQFFHNYGPGSCEPHLIWGGN